MHARSVLLFLTAALVMPAAVATPAWSFDDGDTFGISLAEPSSGDVDVVVSASPASSYPFVQVRLVKGSNPTAAGLADAIATPLAPNPDGSDVTISVPTWGLGSGVTATYVLFACTTEDPGTCTRTPAELPTTVTQTMVPTTSWDVPGSPLFPPDDAVTIGTEYDGGGALIAREAFYDRGTWVDRERDLPRHGTSVLTDFPATAYTGQVGVEVCSELTDSRNYCVNDSGRSFDYIGAQSLNANRLSQTTVISNPELPGSQVRLGVFAAPDADSLTWVLRDSTGDVLAGPEEIGPFDENGKILATVSPIAAADGPVPDGDYTLDLVGTWHKGDSVAHATGSVPITVRADPPADHPQVWAFERVWRPHAWRMKSTPYVAVQAYDDMGDDAVVRLDTPEGDHYFRPITREPGDVWRVDFEIFDDVGSSDLPRGRYSGVLLMPDSYGRIRAHSLGMFEVWDRRTTTQLRDRSARAALVARKGDRRTYEVRLPRLADLDKISDISLKVRSGRSTGDMQVRLLGQRVGWRTVSLDRGATSYGGRQLLGLDQVVVQVRTRAPLDSLKVVGSSYVWRAPRSTSSTTLTR